METKVLATIKKLLDLTNSESVFDDQLLILINDSILSLKKLDVLSCLPTFEVSNETEWTAIDILPELLNSAKTYIFLTTRMTFDPPTNTQYKAALDAKIKELEYRFSMYEEVILPEEPVEEEL